MSNSKRSRNQTTIKSAGKSGGRISPAGAALEEVEAPGEEGNYTYILECGDGSLYCGWTNKLAERIRAHNEGRGAKYTKGRGPVRLVYYESFPAKNEALRRENEIKKLTRSEKLKLIAAAKPH